jgi:hypothetical protein
MQRAVRDLTGASAEAGDQRPWSFHGVNARRVGRAAEQDGCRARAPVL